MLNEMGENPQWRTRGDVDSFATFNLPQLLTLLTTLVRRGIEVVERGKRAKEHEFALNGENIGNGNGSLAAKVNRMMMSIATDTTDATLHGRIFFTF